MPQQRSPFLSCLLTWLVSARRWLRVLWVCRASVASVVAGAVLATRPQVHDLYLDVAGTGAPTLWSPYFEDVLHPLFDGAAGALLLTLFWALPVHSVARLAVSDPAWLQSPYALPLPRGAKRNPLPFETAATWIPRVLGGLCYACALWAAGYAWWVMPIAAHAPLAQRADWEIFADAAFLIIAAILFIRYMLTRRDALNKRLPHNWKLSLAPAIGLHSDDQKAGRFIDETVAIALLLVLAIAFIRPSILGLTPRLWLLPLLLGIWTPILGLLARYGYKWRAPLGLIALVILVVCFYVAGDNHRTDSFPLAQNSPPSRPSLTEAIEAWETANNCSGEDCPAPIIVLISGGASRSAFFAGGVLGLLTDVSCASNNGDSGPCPEEPAFPKQVFALSSVSGGSVGAAIFAKALSDGGVNGAYAPPCLREKTSTLFFRAEATDWRGCLEEIAAEDFLSPVIAGLGFRDVLGFLGSWLGECVYPDRGHRLETAFADAYLKYMNLSEAGCASERKFGLSAPFLSLAPHLVDPKAPRVWSPILLMNSTSSEAGKRFLFSAVAPTMGPTDPSRWLKDSYDFHETLPGADLSLASAAHNSARFPVISPAGELFDNAKKLFSRLVDGGYFDNYGASTARDLVPALEAQHLKPFVLVITNDPVPVKPEAPGQPATDAPARPAAGNSLIPSLIAAPLNAVLETRSARGELALADLAKLYGLTDDKPRIARVAVHAQDLGANAPEQRIKDRIEAVSMSWWLSKPVQQYLDNQLESPAASDAPLAEQRQITAKGQRKNAEELGRVCDALRPLSLGSSCRRRVAVLAHDND